MKAMLDLRGCCQRIARRVRDNSRGLDENARHDRQRDRGSFRECRQLAADESWRMSWERYFYDPRFMPSLCGRSG
jgi:hypothetical protein